MIGNGRLFGTPFHLKQIMLNGSTSLIQETLMLNLYVNKKSTSSSKQ